MFLEHTQHSLDIQASCTPDYILLPLFAFLLGCYILEVKGDDTLVEHAQAIHLLESLAIPMSHIGTRTKVTASALDSLEQILGLPVVGRLRMIVYRHLDAIFA